MCFVVTCWERAGLFALVCGVYCEFITFPLYLGQVWYLIVSIPDLCTLTCFELIFWVWSGLCCAVLVIVISYFTIISIGKRHGYIGVSVHRVIVVFPGLAHLLWLLRILTKNLDINTLISLLGVKIADVTNVMLYSLRRSWNKFISCNKPTYNNKTFNLCACVQDQVYYSKVCSFRPINNLSVNQWLGFLCWTSTKLGSMCLAQGLQRSDAGETQSRGPSVSPLIVCVS